MIDVCRDRLPVGIHCTGNAGVTAVETSGFQAWKDRVKRASRSSLPDGHYFTDGPVSVTLFYFPATEIQGDIDNIVKPILDALCQHIYVDDRQVERVWVQKFEPDKIFQFAAPSATLSSAIQGDKPLLYVRLSDDPTEGLSCPITV